MILIGIMGLCFVIIFYVVLYLYFMRRTDRFIESWRKELREKIEKITLQEIKPLEEAAEALKASRMAMEEFAIKKGYMSKLVSKEMTIPKTIIETLSEPIVVSTATSYFAPYGSRKPKEWENWVLPAKPALSTS